MSAKARDIKITLQKRALCSEGKCPFCEGDKVVVRPEAGWHDIECYCFSCGNRWIEHMTLKSLTVFKNPDEVEQGDINTSDEPWFRK